MNISSTPKFSNHFTLLLSLICYPPCNQYQSKHWKATNEQIWKHGKEDGWMK